LVSFIYSFLIKFKVTPWFLRNENRKKNIFLKTSFFEKKLKKKLFFFLFSFLKNHGVTLNFI